MDIGQRVRLTLTGECGTITAAENGGLLIVTLDGMDFGVPVALEHLEPETPPTVGQSAPAAEGLLLVFLPEKRGSDQESEWQVKVVNATSCGCLYQYRWCIDGSPTLQRHGQLEADAIGDLPRLRWDDLNRSPKVDILCWPATNTGSGSKLDRTVRLRPHLLLGTTRFIAQLDCHAPAVVLFPSLPAKKKNPEQTRLQDYTRQHTDQKPNHAFAPTRLAFRDPAALVSFNQELDLHIESLTSRHAQMTGSEKLQFQLHSFDQWLDRGIRLGVPRLVAIHGLGKGRLREELFARLSSHPDVSDFRNEYHPKYGFGATEIFLD